MSEGLIEDVFGRIDDSKEDLAEIALELGNTYGPVGNEEPTARRVYEWYRDNGMDADLVPMIEGRASVVGKVRGDGTGKSLIFNAHLDTEASGPEYDRLMNAPDPNLVGARPRRRSPHRAHRPERSRVHVGADDRRSGNQRLRGSVER